MIAKKEADEKDRRMDALYEIYAGETLEPGLYISHAADLAAVKGAKLAAHKRMMEVGELLVPKWAEGTGNVDSTDDGPGSLDDRLPPEIADVVRDWLQMCHGEMQNALLPGDTV